jgi:type IX secretion system substrate protein/immune inhibitor InhA-like protein
MIKLLQEAPFTIKTKYWFLLLSFITFTNIGLSQIVPTEAAIECFVAGNGGVFQDIGGTADYPNCNCVSTTTLCAVDGSAITIDFTSFMVNEPFDWLVILDNDNPTSLEFPTGTQLFNNSDGVGDGGADNYGVGANLGEGTLAELTSTTFTATNPTGCLTFVFRSSAVVANPGWEADISTSTGSPHPGDNLDCSTNVNCLPASNLTLGTVLWNGADFSWTASPDAVNYNVEYGNSGYVYGTGMSDITNLTDYSISGLLENTSYDFYVQADCGSGELSSPLGPITFTTPFENPPVTCDYTLELFDSFGDGWNGSFLTVNVNGVETTYTIPVGGSNATYTFEAISNLPVIISYTAGSFQNEVTYNVLDPSGNVIFNDGPFPQTGVVYTFFACPTCPGPLAVSVDNVGGIEADISWSPSDSSGIYTVEYGPAGFIQGTGTTFMTSLTSATISGLDENTLYDFYVSISCDNGDNSAVVGPTTFQTIWLIDVGVIAIHSPESQCGLGVETVEVTLKNFGASPQSLIPFNFSVNNVSAGVSQPLDGYYTGVISNDSTVTLVFETTFDFSVAGEYEILAWTDLADDSNISNDTSSYSVTSIPTVADFPYFIDFETWDGGWAIDTEFSVNSTWEFGMPAGPDISSAASGVNAFVTNLDGNYNNSELSYIISPCFDFSSLAADPVINFSIYYETETNWDGAWLEASLDGGMTWAKIGAMGTGVNWYTVNNTTQGLGDIWAGNSAGWINAEHTLTGVSGESTVRLRFAFDSDGSVNGFDGIGIDDIFISPVFADDLSSLSVTNTTTSECGDEMDQVVLEIRNAGINGQTAFDVYYQINGGAPVMENVGPLVINAGLIETYTFSTTFDSKMLGTDFEIKAWTALDDELNFLNDSTSYTFSTVTPDPLPIIKDFEDNVVPAGWTVSDNGIGNVHNNVSVVIYDNLYAGDQSYTVTSSILGPINPGDSLTFDYRYTNWSAGTVATVLGAGDSLAIQISTDCGETFTTTETVNMSNHTPSAVMTNRLVDLDPYAGEYIQLRFLATWGSGDYWIDLDNINIIGCPANFGLDVTTIYESSTGAGDGSITIIPTQGTAPFNIVWDDPNAPNDISAGTYTATVTDGLGCEQILTIELGVCPENLALSADVTGVSVAGESDGSATINVGDGDGPFTFEWSNGDSTATVSNLAEGEYSVTVTNANGCAEEIAFTVDIFVSIHDLEGQFANLSLAPNPTSGLTELSVELNQSAEVVVQVLDVLGQVIFESSREQLISKKYQLDMSEHADGMYFIRVFANKHSQIIKLIKS